MASELADLIRLHQEAIQRLDSEIADKTRERESHISELIEAKRLLLGDVGVIIAPPPPVQALNSTSMAEAVLRSAGHPLHVNEILIGIEKKFHARAKYAT